jgi:NAD(P)-dependent dehydrogenase (short-subunit alcohol dehydrogenase family)
VVIITGASSGIGRATAREFARGGARVVLAARSAEGLAAAQRECLADGGQALVVPTDVVDAGQVEALLTAARQRFGRVDAVVHAAAVIAYGRFEDVPVAVFDRVVATNVTGTANVARAALACFRAQGGGRLIVVGSLLGNMAAPFISSYVTSKWAVHGLSRTLRLEARELPGVEVGLVWPGSVNTPAYSQAANYFGRVGRPPPPVDPPEKVARQIVRAARRPPRGRSVGLANHVMVLGFRVLPATFDALVVPLMKVGGISGRPVEETSGNVLAAQGDGEAVHGRWGRHWMRPAGLAAAVGTATALSRLAVRSRRR